MRILIDIRRIIFIYHIHLPNVYIFCFTVRSIQLIVVQMRRYYTWFSHWRITSLRVWQFPIMKCFWQGSKTYLFNWAFNHIKMLAMKIYGYCLFTSVYYWTILCKHIWDLGWKWSMVSGKYHYSQEYPEICRSMQNISKRILKCIYTKTDS